MYGKICGALAVALCAFLTGCSTALVSNLAEHITVTAPDGTVTVTRRAENKVKSFGDKAVAQTLNQSIADATEEDLSAGIGTVDQKSESGAIADMIGNLGGKALDTLGAYYGAKANSVPDIAVSGGKGGGGNSASSNTAVPGTPSGAAIRTVVGAEGSPTIVILGNKAPTGGCSLCKSLDAKIDYSEISSELCGATVVDADLSSNPAVFKQYSPSGGYKFPYVRVYDGEGKLAGEFVARSPLNSQAAIISQVEKFVPGCAIQ